MRRSRTLLFLVFCPLFAASQQDDYLKAVTGMQKDSLRRELQLTKSDTAKMLAARSLGFYYQEINRDSALYFHDLQLRIAQQLKMKLWQADALDQGGWVLAELKNHPLSLTYFLEAHEILEDPGSETDGFYISHIFKGRNPTTVRQILKGFLHNDLSQLYEATGDVQQKMAHLHKGLELGKELQYYAILSLITLNLSDAHHKGNKIDSALFYSLQAIGYMEKVNYRIYYGAAHTDAGKAYLKMENYDLAKKYFDKSVALNIIDDNRVKLSDSYYALGEYFIAINKPDSAALYFNKARLSYKSMGELEELNRTYTALYRLYKNHDAADSAAHYVELSKILGDSLSKADRRKIYEYQNIGFSEQIKRQEAEQARIDKANKFRTLAMLAAIAVFIFIVFLLYRNVRNRKKANLLLQEQKEKIELTLEELKATQSQLVQSEKMASLGELTAGIAHEIQNPLNFVNNFSEVSKELLDEMQEAIKKRDEEELNKILHDVIQNLEKINHHGKRADAIVKGMLQHSRKPEGQKEPTDINALCDEYLRLSYHGLRAKDKSFNATLKTEFDDSLGAIQMIPQEIGRVVLNLLNNAFYAVNEKKQKQPAGYEPTVSISTKQGKGNVMITVSDNGNGIPKHIADKIFQPFFTTKPTGQGTGLGLSLAYDIVTKGHGGELKVETRENEGSIFIILLPIN